MGTVLSKSSQAGELDREFDQNQVKGNIIITKKVAIPTFQTRSQESHWTLQECPCIGGAIPQCQNIFILGNTTELKPGGSGVDVVL